MKPDERLKTDSRPHRGEESAVSSSYQLRALATELLLAEGRRPSQKPVTSLTQQLREQISKTVSELAPSIHQEICEAFLEQPNTKILQKHVLGEKRREILLGVIQESKRGRLDILARLHIPQEEVTKGRFIIAQVLIDSPERKEVIRAIQRRKRLVRAAEKYLHPEDWEEAPGQTVREFQRDSKLITSEIRAQLGVLQSTYSRMEKSGIFAQTRAEKAELGRQNGQRLFEEGRGIFGITTEEQRMNAQKGGLAYSERKHPVELRDTLPKIIAECEQRFGKRDWNWIKERAHWPSSRKALIAFYYRHRKEG